MNDKVISNLLWRFLERCGAQVVTFVVSIVLARLLSPEDYGLIAIITVIITILNVFIDGGFANALIQKKDADDLDFSTVFYFNIVFCIALYVMVFVLSPLVGVFYGDEKLVPLLRVLALTIVIAGIKNVQQAYVSKHFLFKKFFYATLGGTLFSAALGIVMALNGYGVWSLVFQHLSNALIDTVILWVTVKWRPIRAFSYIRLMELFSYGYKLLLSSLLNTIYSNFRQLIIGKQYSSSDLAFYNRGKQFPSLVMTNINTSIDSVLFPAMSEKQNDIPGLRYMIKKSINVSSYLLWPVLFGMCAVAEPLIKLLLTEKWIMTVPYLQVFCFVFATFPIQTANLNALKAVGRSDLFFKLEIEQTVVGIILLIVAIPIGPLWIAIMYLITSLCSCFLIAHETNKVFNYSIYAQIRDVMPNLILSSIMFVAVYSVTKIIIYNWFMIVEVLIGIIVYILGSILLKNENMNFAVELVKGIISK